MLKEKLHENVAQHLEPGERIGESGLVTNNLKTRNTALVATDRNLYAFRLKWPGQSRVAEQVLVVPIAEVRLEGSGRHVRLVNRTTGAVMQQWRRLPRDLTALGEFVDSAGPVEADPKSGAESPK